MCLLRLDLSSLAGVLHATNSWQSTEFSSSPVPNFLQAAPAHCLWICLHRARWRIQAGIRLFSILFFQCVRSEMAHLWSWNRLLAYWWNTMLPWLLEIPERNDDVSMYFLKFFLRIVFPNVKFRYQYLAVQCTVSGSSLSMLFFPDCRSRQARLLLGRASFGVIIMQKSPREEGREDTAASIPVLVCLGFPAGSSSQKRRLPWSPPAVLSHILQAFSHRKVLSIVSNSPNFEDYQVLSISQKSSFMLVSCMENGIISRSCQDKPDHFRQFLSHLWDALKMLCRQTGIETCMRDAVFWFELWFQQSWKKWDLSQVFRYNFSDIWLI